MEDKQYLDEAGLSEVGKVISKFYASKDDLSKIDVTEQLADYAKKTDIPTNLSQFTNDKSFKTEDEIKKLINDSNKLKKEVVTSLPSSGVDDVVYLLKNKSDSNNICTEYLWINGNWEIIGDTKVDLTDYAKKTDLDNKVNKVDGKQLSTNDYSNNDKKSIEDWRKKQKWNEFLEWCTLQMRDVVDGTPDFALVDGTYNIRLNERIYGNGDELDPRVSAWGDDVTPSNEWSYKLLSSQTMSIDGEVRLIVKKLNINFQPVSSKNEKCFVSQEIVNPINNISITRITQKPKIEYSDEHIFQLWQNKNKDVNFEEIVTHDDWGQWSVVSADWRAPTLFPVMPETTKAGLMLPEDKKKLDSIDVEAINSANKSNANTIKVCDVEKEILSKGADAPVGLYIDSDFAYGSVKMYYVESSTFGVPSKRYTVWEITPTWIGLNQPMQTFEWKNNRWNKIHLPQPTLEQNSNAFRLLQLERKINQLETALKSLSPTPPPPVVVPPQNG